MKDKKGNGFGSFAFLVLLGGILALFVGVVLWYKGVQDRETDERAKEAFENVKEHAPSTRAWETEANEELNNGGSFHFTIKSAETASTEDAALKEDASSEAKASSEAAASSEEEASSETEDSSETEASSEEETETGPDAVYSSVLKRYKDALAGGWRSTTGVSPLWQGQDTQVNMELAGFEYLDLNGDSFPELLVSVKQEPPYDSMLLDLYTAQNGVPKKLLSSDEENTWFLCEDNRLLFYTSDGEGTAKVATYTLDPKTARLVSDEILLRDRRTYPEFDALYTDKKGYDPTFYEKGLDETMDPLMADSANVVYDRLTGLRIPLVLTPFS
ncbi:MAG: hypothetical protein II754_02995 [Lachnospiraceae bacterium]|nr:hypothetical protein [Lachnospiraceae bacterium]